MTTKVRQKSHGSTRNYKFGQKNNWRRWLWNEILRRTTGRHKTECVLYLAGRNDLDRQVATRKGIPSANMIAIDRCAENVASIRLLGGSAICADAIDVLRAWPSSRPVCAIVLDFCSGLLKREQTRLLFGLMSAHPSLRDAVIAVNFMRGRDSSEESQYLRTNWCDAAREIRDRYGDSARYQEQSESFCEKHRGMAFFFGYVLHVTSAALRSGTVLDQIEAATPRLLQLVDPKPYSYRSGTLVFDSVVMSPISSVLAIADDPLVELQKSHPKDLDVARSVAATLAVRTRRMGVTA